MVEYHFQFLTVRLDGGDCGSYFITIVYASCDRNVRRDLFDSLYRFGNGINAPWIVGGDFNCVLSPDEKVGGIMQFLNSMIDFQGFVAALGLSDAGYKGSTYTWSNKQSGRSFIKARLDRVLFNSGWSNLKHVLEVNHLIRGVSDHSPLLVLRRDSAGRRVSRFIFQKMWTTHEGFLDFVKEVWNSVQVARENHFNIL